MYLVFDGICWAQLLWFTVYLIWLWEDDAKNILFLINNFFTNPRDYKLICICLQKVQMPKMFACHMVSTHMLCSLLQSEQLQIVWHHKDSLLV